MRTSLVAWVAIVAGWAVLGAARADIDPRLFDRSVSPAEDFFRYVNGGWIDRTAIPAEAARWGSFDELRERNWQILKGLCEGAAAKGPAGTAAERMVGDFFASGMDEVAIAAAGLSPLRPELDRVDAIKTSADVLVAIAHLRRAGIGAAFGFTGAADAKNSDVTIAQLRQGGLSLPGTGRASDRDYYTKGDERSRKLRENYVAHVARMFALAGEAPAAAEAGAAAVLRIETALAQGSLPRTELRDPKKSYHKIKVVELPAYTGALDWPAFFAATGAPAFQELNLAHPGFFRGLAALLAQAPVADWQAYLRWHVLLTAAPYLSAPFVEENFRFYETEVRGVKEQKPRWRRVVAWIDGARLDNIAGIEGGIGEALGQLYVAEYFPPAAKQRVLQLVADLRAALRERIQALDWMDAPTRAQALAKLEAFGVKMGYPDKWRDYRGLQIDRGPLVRNVLRARAFDWQRDLGRIGLAPDKTEWGMTVPTVNASYGASTNTILFPAGILQPPFFDPKADDAVNYGGIGAVIGHEMTHGFDDSGRQFDAKGNLVDWWTPASAANYQARALAIVQQFGAYTVLDGVPLKGLLTQGENIADLGGIAIAYAALQKALAGREQPKIDGFTPEQRFFLSWARIWRDLMRPEEQRRRVNIDPHSPGRWRVNGPLSNLDAFARAFNVPEGAPMRRPAAERVAIW